MKNINNEQLPYIYCFTFRNRKKKQQQQKECKNLIDKVELLFIVESYFIEIKKEVFNS